jgi:hypothetical protein
MFKSISDPKNDQLAVLFLQIYIFFLNNFVLLGYEFLFLATRRRYNVTSVKEMYFECTRKSCRFRIHIHNIYRVFRLIFGSSKGFGRWSR